MSQVVVTATCSSPKWAPLSSAVSSAQCVAIHWSNGGGSAATLTKTNPPLVHVVAPQWQRRLVHLAVVEVRGGDQPAVERVRPRVVRAHQRALAGVGVLIAEPGAAMAADVGERVQRPSRARAEQHALAGQLDDGAVARLQPIGAGGEHPAAVEDALALQLVHLVGEVVEPACGCRAAVPCDESALPCSPCATLAHFRRRLNG